MSAAGVTLVARRVPAEVGHALAERFEAGDPGADLAGSVAWNRAAARALGEERSVGVAVELPGAEAGGHAALAVTRAGWRSGSPGQPCLAWPMHELGFGFAPRLARPLGTERWLEALQAAFPSHRLELTRCRPGLVADAPAGWRRQEGVGTWVRAWDQGVADGPEYLASLQGKHRRDLGKARREIEAAGGQWVDHEQADPAALDACFALHRARLLGKGARSAYFAATGERFLRELARQMSGCGLRLTLLRRGDRLLAACLSFVFARRYKAFVSGWIPAEAKLDLGRQVIFHQVLGEIERGVREIDLLGGDLAYKREFGLAKRATLDLVRVPGVVAAARERIVQKALVVWRGVRRAARAPR